MRLLADGHAGGELVTIADSLTQKKAVENQMKEAGARFFDLRPRRVGFWPIQTWYTCHGAVLGQRFSTIFKTGKEFVENHQSEVVFMRISHCKYDELEELIDMLRKDYDWNTRTGAICWAFRTRRSAGISCSSSPRRKNASRDSLRVSCTMSRPNRKGHSAPGPKGV